MVEQLVWLSVYVYLRTPKILYLFWKQGMRILTIPESWFLQK